MHSSIIAKRGGASDQTSAHSGTHTRGQACRHDPSRPAGQQSSKPADQPASKAVVQQTISPAARGLPAGIDTALELTARCRRVVSGNGANDGWREMNCQEKVWAGLGPRKVWAGLGARTVGRA